MTLDERILSDLLKRAQEAHHQFETETGTPDPNWAEWYATWISAYVRENEVTLILTPALIPG